MTKDATDLQRYAEKGEEAAFERLVTAYLPLVYSTALRLVNRDEHLARDVTQLVFANLARKASNLPPTIILAGWLHRDTRFTALELIRKEKRRRRREATASEFLLMNAKSADIWDEVAPVLDDALSALTKDSRDALLLRFFRQLSLKEVGEVLGVGESGASRRVASAIESLQKLLRKKGMAISTSSLATFLATRSLEAVAATEAAAILLAIKSTQSVVAISSTSGLALFMTTNAKMAIGAVAAIALLMGSFAWRRKVADTHKALSPNEEIVGRDYTANIGVATPSLHISGAQSENKMQKSDARLARIREILFLPGTSGYPPDGLEEALEDLQPDRRAALPIILEAMRSESLEIRRRALSAVLILKKDALEAIPQVLELLGKTQDPLEVIGCGEAIESMGTNASIIPDLAEIMKTNVLPRMEIAMLISRLALPGTPEAVRAADFFRPLLNDSDTSLAGEAARVLAMLGDTAEQRLVLQNAFNGLNSANQDDQAAALTTLANLKDSDSNSVPVLRNYLRTARRPDLQMFAHKVLRQHDSGYADFISSPELVKQERERVAKLAAHAEKGSASMDELIQALAGGPEAITLASHIITSQGMGGFETENRQKVSEAVAALNTICQSEPSLEARLAAAKAFTALQPTQPRPIYSVEELAPALMFLHSNLDGVSAAESEARRSLNAMLDIARTVRASSHQDEMTDYPSHLLSFLAGELKRTDPAIGKTFEDEMHKIDPNFR